MKVSKLRIGFMLLVKTTYEYGLATAQRIEQSIKTCVKGLDVLLTHNSKATVTFFPACIPIHSVPLAATKEPPKPRISSARHVPLLKCLVIASSAAPLGLRPSTSRAR